MRLDTFHLTRLFSNDLFNILSDMLFFLVLFIYLSEINSAIKNKLSINVMYTLSIIILFQYGPFESILLSFAGTYIRQLFTYKAISWRKEACRQVSLLLSACVYVVCNSLYLSELKILSLFFVIGAYQFTYFIFEIRSEMKDARFSLIEYTKKVWKNEWYIYTYTFFNTTALVLLYPHHPFLTLLVIVGSHFSSQYFIRYFYLLQKRGEMRDLKMQKSINTELKLARQVQFQLLKPTPRIIEGWRIDADYCPAKQVSGDYYDIAYTHDKKIRLLIADVMGKGLAASLLMATLSAITRERMKKSPSPKDLLSFINTQLYENLKASAAFITILCIDIDPVSGTLTYCSAGHHPPFIRSADGKVRMLTSGRNVSVGMLPNPQFNEGTDQINKEDYLLLYTDGAIEIREQNHIWGRTALQQYLTDWSSLCPTHELSKELISELTEKSKNGLSDDITLLSMSFTEEMDKYDNEFQHKGVTVHAAL